MFRFVCVCVCVCQVMSGDLSAAQQAAREGPSKTTQSLIEQLRHQLAAKDKQQRVGIV